MLILPLELSWSPIDFPAAYIKQVSARYFSNPECVFRRKSLFSDELFLGINWRGGLLGANLTSFPPPMVAIWTPTGILTDSGMHLLTS